ncbi:hypothetical protein DFH09DRAFT_1170457 [Mycena vulgaris]|nr:hypothetical protein DFH09DRAFT_1170457 [Mycena vulgaris]
MLRARCYPSRPSSAPHLAAPRRSCRARPTPWIWRSSSFPLRRARASSATLTWARWAPAARRPPRAYARRERPHHIVCIWCCCLSSRRNAYYNCSRTLPAGACVCVCPLPLETVTDGVPLWEVAGISRHVKAQDSEHVPLAGGLASGVRMYLNYCNTEYSIDTIISL